MKMVKWQNKQKLIDYFLRKKMENIVNYIKDVIEIIRDIIGEIFYI